MHLQTDSSSLNPSDKFTSTTHGNRSVELRPTEDVTDSNQNSDPGASWTDVVKRRAGKTKSANKPVFCGSSSNSSIKVVQTEQRKKAIFLSRLGPDVTISEITEFLTKHNLKHLKVNKLRTKYDSYSSFHIELEEERFDELFDAKHWPKGSFISQFYGKLKTEQVIGLDENSKEQRE